jgi:hypothetical protein
MSLLERGSVPLELYEDGPTVMIVTPLMIDKHGRTYEIPNK